MSTLAKNEDPDEMLHDAAFHQGLHRLLRQKRSSENGIQYYLEIIKPMTTEIYSETSQVYSIKPEGRIHLCIKG